MKFIHISRPFGSYYSLPPHFTKLSSFIAIHLAGDANKLIRACAICFSLSSASPAHSPKEEYVITQCTDTLKEEAADDQEDRREPQGDKSEPAEKKSLAGWLAAHPLLQGENRCIKFPVMIWNTLLNRVHPLSSVPFILSEEVPLCGLCPSLGHDGQEEEKSWEEQLDAHQEQLEKEMHEARRMVFRLQVSHSAKTRPSRVNTWTQGCSTDAPAKRDNVPQCVAV